MFLSNFNWQPLFLTTKLAFATTLILVIFGIPIAYALAFTKNKLKPVFEALVGMPLVLPPTVIGFYFLIAFSPSHGLGKWLNDIFNIQLVFSFSGLVLASIIYSLPFMVQPIQNGLQNLPKNLPEAAYVLGKSKWQTFWRVLLPNCQNSILTGMVLTFAHTIGEFGVVLMVGGSIPNKTQVVSSVIYEQVEALNYGTAHTYSAILLAISFLVLVVVYSLSKYNNCYLRRNN
ncbi:molybdate ABC transporter permease subunit [Aquimarina agarivorans]|uniref:molybdate ABC transporter permease subunit n=1 Tax=Aquimarina agarivorans TaxID=980584 RepID=UPI000248E796